MFTFLSTIYIINCLFLILVVLLQSGKGSGMGAAFGGGSQTAFGGAGAGNFLTRLTSISAALFMILSATLAYLSSSSEKSLQQVSDLAAKNSKHKSGNISQYQSSSSAKKSTYNSPVAPMSKP